MLEAQFQAELIKRLYQMFPQCAVLKQDTDYQQGIPDLVIFWEDRWAMLEVKKSPHAKLQPNQAYYVSLFDNMSFCAFIYPENEEEVLDALQRSFKSRRTTRFPKS